MSPYRNMLDYCGLSKLLWSELSCVHPYTLVFSSVIFLYLCDFCHCSIQIFRNPSTPHKHSVEWTRNGYLLMYG